MEENKEAYVSLVTAKALKSIGFDFPVRSFYQEPIPGTELERRHKEDIRRLLNERHDMPFSIKDWNHEEARTDDRMYYSCPTLAVAQRWLREVHHVSVEGGYARRPDNYVTIVIVPQSLEDLFGQNFEIGVQARDFSSYEEAVEWGIEFVLKALLKGCEQ